MSKYFLSFGPQSVSQPPTVSSSSPCERSLAFARSMAKSWGQSIHTLMSKYWLNFGCSSLIPSKITIFGKSSSKYKTFPLSSFPWYLIFLPALESLRICSMRFQSLWSNMPDPLGFGPYKLSIRTIWLSLIPKWSLSVSVKCDLHDTPNPVITIITCGLFFEICSF